MQLRRERIAERMKALQELVPSANKVSDFLVQLYIYIYNVICNQCLFCVPDFKEILYLIPSDKELYEVNTINDNKKKGKERDE